MKYEEFESLYAKARKIRDEFAPQMRPWFTAEASTWPPIIGFGVPSDSSPVTLATVGLNPSNRGVFAGHVWSAAIWAVAYPQLWQCFCSSQQL